jgi:hypothetical protein
LPQDAADVIYVNDQRRSTRHGKLVPKTP